MITMDRDTSSIVLSRSDGKEARFPLQASPFADTSALSSLHYPPSLDGLVAVTRARDDITFELPSPDHGDQLAGRLIIYLDQNQWSAIDNNLHDEARGNAKNRDAARQLAEWVRQRRIILPASSGHYNETTKRFDASKRYRLGLTILQLSRGWQMRDPLQVRRDELHDTFCRRLGREFGMRATAVFTLAPNVIHSASRGATPYVPPPDFHPDLAFQHEALTSATSLIDVMLDSERLDPDPPTGWVKANQQFTDQLHRGNWDAQQKRKAVDDLFLSDVQREIEDEASAVGMSPERLRQWKLKQVMEDVRELPATGLYREVLHDKHLDKRTCWKPNDLTDILYLSCAAGYADFVVCERHMRGILAQGLRRLERQAQVFRQLPDAVSAIGAALTSRA